MTAPQTNIVNHPAFSAVAEDAADEVTPSLENGGGGGHGGDMDDVTRRVGALEGHVKEVRGILARLEPMLIRVDAQLEAALPTLATRAELAEKPGKGYLWGVLGVLIAAVLASVAAGAAIATLLK